MHLNALKKYGHLVISKGKKILEQDEQNITYAARNSRGSYYPMANRALNTTLHKDKSNSLITPTLPMSWDQVLLKHNKKDQSGLTGFPFHRIHCSLSP